MVDDKRYLRELKKDIKKRGNRKRRRYLKNVGSEPSDFDFGRDRTDVMNEPTETSRGSGDPNPDAMLES